MDTKEVRRNLYEKKVSRSYKLDQQYAIKKLPQEIQQLLNEQIPNATLRQLYKLIDKQYTRIIKLYPSVQNTIKKVIQTKLQKIPEQIRKSQIQRLISHIEAQYPHCQFQIKEKDYYLVPKDKSVTQKDHTTYFIFQNQYIRVPYNSNKVYILIDTTKKNQSGKGMYTVYHHNPNHRHEKIFASTEEIQDNEDYKINNKKGNFERNAINLIEKFIQFKQKMNTIQNH